MYHSNYWNSLTRLIVNDCIVGFVLHNLYNLLTLHIFYILPCRIMLTMILCALDQQLTGVEYNKPTNFIYSICSCIENQFLWAVI